MTPYQATGFKFVALAFLTSRILCLVAFVAVDFHLGNEHPSLAHQIASYGNRWDSGYYHRIAENGYDFTEQDIERGNAVYAFYPALPYLAKALHTITGIPIGLAGMLISNACFLGALWLFSLYCQKRVPTGTAKQAILLLAFCPQNFVFSAFYTESLFLFLTLLAWVAFDSNRTALSCVSAACLSAVRSNGIFVILYFIAQGIARMLEAKFSKTKLSERIDRIARTALPVMTAPLGLVAYWWICFSDTGDAFAQKSAAFHGWGVEISVPFAAAIERFGTHFHETFWIIGGLCFLLASFPLFRKGLKPDFLYVLANLLLVFSNARPQSLLRYVIVLFPVYLAISLITASRKILFILVLILFNAVNLYLCHAWLTNNPIAI